MSRPSGLKQEFISNIPAIADIRFPSSSQNVCPGVRINRGISSNTVTSHRFNDGCVYGD